MFGLFRERMLKDEELAAQLEASITMVRANYNAAIYENRFIVGGAAEHLLAAAFNGAGLPAQHVGRGNTGGDILVRDPKGGEVGFSSKASFSTPNVRLVNTLGNAVPSWKDATLFLLTNVGIAYSDPELLPDATIQANGALVLDGRKLMSWIDRNPGYVIPMKFAKPSTGSIASSRTASEDVARNVLKSFPRLTLL